MKFVLLTLGKTTYFKSSIINLDQIIISDSEKVISVMEKAFILKSQVSSLLNGENSLEKSIIITAPNETLNLLKV